MDPSLIFSATRKEGAGVVPFVIEGTVLVLLDLEGPVSVLSYGRGSPNQGTPKNKLREVYPAYATQQSLVSVILIGWVVGSEKKAMFLLIWSKSRIRESQSRGDWNGTCTVITWTETIRQKKTWDDMKLCKDGRRTHSLLEVGTQNAWYRLPSGSANSSTSSSNHDGVRGGSPLFEIHEVA